MRSALSADVESAGRVESVGVSVGYGGVSSVFVDFLAEVAAHSLSFGFDADDGAVPARSAGFDRDRELDAGGVLNTVEDPVVDERFGDDSQPLGFGVVSFVSEAAVADLDDRQDSESDSDHYQVDAEDGVVKEFECWGHKCDIGIVVIFLERIIYSTPSVGQPPSQVGIVFGMTDATSETIAIPGLVDIQNPNRRDAKIEAVGYDEHSERLFVLYFTGTLVAYEGVAAEMLVGILANQSAERFLKRFVTGRHESFVVDGD